MKVHSAVVSHRDADVRRACRLPAAWLSSPSLPLERGGGPPRCRPSATPASSQLFGVHPVQEGRTTLPGGHFNFALVPGQRISDGIVIVNFSSHALHFHVYGADLLDRDRRRTRSGTADRDNAPGRRLDRRVGAGDHDRRARPVDRLFTISVPAAAAPGSILGLLWLQRTSGSRPREIRLRRVRH